MANYTYISRAIIAHRWELQLPTNGIEMQKAFSAASTSWFEHYDPDGMSCLPDDALTVTAEDDTLVISFTVEEK